MVEEDDGVTHVACNYFFDLFTSQSLGDMSRLLFGISIRVTDDMNEGLLTPLLRMIF